MVIVLERNGRVLQGGVVPGGLLARWSTSDGKTLLDINIAPFMINVLGCTVTTPNPVLLNSAISLGKTMSAGGLNMDFNARYYQTTPSNTAGEANSTASFTINYE
jgi:hypothetical protein